MANKMKTFRGFILTSGLLLMVAATAKLISAFGSSKILEGTDPVLLISFRYVFILAGAIEVGIGTICLFGRRIWLQLWLLAWFSTICLIYRFYLKIEGYYPACKCLGLGEFTTAIHISQKFADVIMKVVLGYLLIGSYATLFWLWRQHRKAEGRMQNDEAKPEAGAGSLKVG